MEVKPALKRGLAALSGVLLYFSFPNALAMGFEPWTGWLAWVALLPLLAAVEGSAPAEGFQLGFISGSLFFLPGLAWLTNVKPMGLGAIPAWCALAAWCALFPGLFAALLARGLKKDWALPLLWVPALWTLTEWLREHIFGGFPWLSLGSSQYANPSVRMLAALTGQPGLHFSVALGSAVAFAVLVRPVWILRWPRFLSGMAVLLALSFGAHQQAVEQAAWDQGAPLKGGLPAWSTQRVGVVQGGIDQDQVWDRTYRESLLHDYFSLSDVAAGKGAKLILWPESCFPGFFNDPDSAPEAAAVKAFARTRKVDLLIGSTLLQGKGYTNCALWVDPAGNTASYAKRHLVPFGEFVPFRTWVPLLDLALEQLGVASLQPGDGPKRFPMGPMLVAPLVCYEIVFPDLAREAEAPDLLAVVTVDTWYGKTCGPVWHASQAAFRAIENGCWVARSAATGISLFAAPDGRLTQSLDLGESGALVQVVGPARPTPYRRYGDWFLVLCLGFLLLCAAAEGFKGLKKR